MSDDSNDLLRKIAGGDEIAFAHFYRLFERRIYCFALSRLNDSFEAADIVNEVMFEVWRNAKRFEGRSKVSTWVFGIARHKAIDRLRKRRPDQSEELHENIADDDGVDPVDVLAATENAKFIQRCMGTLSEAHREVVHLAFFEDLSYPEISAIADCPEGTVKTRMFHAKRALKRCLARLMGKTP